MRLFFDDVVLDASYGVASWLALEARVGARVIDERPRYTELDGSPHPGTDIHHRRETLVGPTDPWLVVRFAAARGRFVVASRLGLSFPLGATEEDPYRLAAAGRSHEHFQLGSGTFMPLAGGAAAWIHPRVELALSALAQASLYENGKGYRASSRAFLASRATVPLLAGGVLRPFATFDLAHEGRDEWHHSERALEIAASEGSSLRSDLFAGAGVAWRFVDPWQVEASGRVRVAQLASASSLSYPAILQVALSTRFDVTY